MADVKLGPSGSEVTLPPFRTIGGPAPTVPVEYAATGEAVDMVDGSKQYNEFEYTPRRFPLSWGFLSAAELATLQALYVIRGQMRYQDNRESATWYDVRISSFGHGRIAAASVDGTPIYEAFMVLDEV